MNTVVVIPTYNERENIIEILNETLKHDVEVLVVDDNSPDGTGEAVEEYMNTHSRVHLLRGQKQGLGAAYIRGFQHALEHMNADVLIEMDADGSHDPADISRLISALGEADFVIGSRYVDGGSISGWNWYRHLVSTTGNFVARILSAMTHVRDCTAGYRAIKAEVLSSINWEKLPQGYSFQIQVLNHALEQGYTVTEIPVHFADRVDGASKLSAMDIMGFCAVAFNLGVKRSLRLSKFLLVGASGVVVNIAAFWALIHLLSVVQWLSIAIATEISILSNFYFHDRWTFHDKQFNSVGARLGRYHISSLGGIIITYGGYYLLLSVTTLPLTGSYAIAVGVASAWNFLLSYFWAWGR